VEDLPEAQVVNSDCVFTLKLNPDNKVFASVFYSASLCLIIVLVAKEGFKMQSLDISSTFTYKELNNTIYIRQPEGYHQRESNIVCKLHKSLYDLKQSARQWNKKLYFVLDILSFQCTQSDNSIYIYSKKNIKIIPVFINNITLVLRDNSAIASIV